VATPVFPARPVRPAKATRGSNFQVTAFRFEIWVLQDWRLQKVNHCCLVRGFKKYQSYSGTRVRGRKAWARPATFPREGIEEVDTIAEIRLGHEVS
jgi:hypothetical protein